MSNNIEIFQNYKHTVLLLNLEPRKEINRLTILEEAIRELTRETIRTKLEQQKIGGY